MVDSSLLNGLAIVLTLLVIYRLVDR